ncbi:MAG: GGDEF domain-containing phosphodiesterase [Proteobacteria bacterium]|nr:GGDEF domain-containing phosphodiesterase [Pseudomonadota bacterium]MBW3616479.1 GGDEF domain-containing phosphodiesterase [Pseudomonadota bacterium]
MNREVGPASLADAPGRELAAVAYRGDWDAFEVLEALGGGDAALWIWEPGRDRLRVAGAARSLGLGPLGDEATSAVVTALTQPQDLALLEDLLRIREAGAEVHARLRMRGGPTLVWRGAWLDDGRAAGAVAAEARFGPGDVDRLTGLLDRPGFLARARAALQSPEVFELVAADLNRLRRLNEALGHERADLVLAALGARLAAAFPPEFLPARIGEDEFAIFVPRAVGGSGAVETLRTALEQPLRIAGFDIFPTLTVGAVEARGGPDAPEAAELLRRAELSVEATRNAAPGAAGPSAYGKALEMDSLSRLALEADLRLAITRGELQAYYQPVVRLETGRVAGFEALVRWKHPKRGLIPPDEFLPLAQEMGLMIEVGRQMLTQASGQLAAWRGRHPSAGALWVSVNLSPGEIERVGLVEEVAELARRHALPSGALKLEITESDIMRDPDAAAEVLHRLRAAGAGLALDDFGTGFSSLSYLTRLPFHTLKIDRYFVMTMLSNEGSTKIVRSVTSLGRDLDMEVVAEGVENAAMAEALLKLGCDYGQGFGYSPALEPTGAEVYLHESLLDGKAPIRTRS